MTVVLKYDGQDVTCKAAACGRDEAYSNFLTDLAKNFMASDMTMQQAFDSTKLGFVAKQIDVSMPKLNFSDVEGSKPQTVVKAEGHNLGGAQVG